MSREVKFRYWHKVRNEFITADVYFLGDGTVWAGDINNLPLVEVTNEIESIQYTGLKDKNGVEIYEGDILRFKHIQENELDAEISEVCWFGDEEWYYPAFDLNGQRIKSHFEGNVLSEILSSGEFDLEIIGNIYEHSHLLEVAQ